MSIKSFADKELIDLGVQQMVPDVQLDQAVISERSNRLTAVFVFGDRGLRINRIAAWASLFYSP